MRKLFKTLDKKIKEIENLTHEIKNNLEIMDLLEIENLLENLESVTENLYHEKCLTIILENNKEQYQEMLKDFKKILVTAEKDIEEYNYYEKEESIEELAFAFMDTGYYTEGISEEKVYQSKDGRYFFLVE